MRLILENKSTKKIPTWEPVWVKINWHIDVEWFIRDSHMINESFISVWISFSSKISDTILWDFLWKNGWWRFTQDENGKNIWGYKLKWNTIFFEWKWDVLFSKEIINLVNTWMYSVININSITNGDSGFFWLLSNLSDSWRVKIIYAGNSQHIKQFLRYFSVQYSQK